MARAPHAHPHYGLHQHTSHAQRLSDRLQPQGVLVPANLFGTRKNVVPVMSVYGLDEQTSHAQRLSDHLPHPFLFLV